MIGFIMKKVRIKIDKTRPPTTTLFISPDSVIISYILWAYKSWENFAENL